MPEEERDIKEGGGADGEIQGADGGADAPGGDADGASEPRRGRAPQAWWALALIPLAAGAVFLALDGDADPTTDGGSAGAGDSSAATADEGRGTARLTIVVTDPAGEPVTDAAVTGRIALPDGTAASRQGQTDAAGRLELAALPAGVVQVTALEGDLAQGFATTQLAEGASETLEIRLEPGQALEGRVLDEAGEPIAGARVASTPATAATADGFEDSGGLEGPEGGPPVETSTGEDGSFRLTNLALGPQRLAASADGYDRIDRRVEPREGAPPLRVILRRTGVIDGRVEIDGEPAGDATLVLSGSGVWPPRSVTSGSDGGFRFEGVPGGIYEVSCRRGDAVADPYEGIILDPGGRLELTLRLRPGLSIGGQVVDATSGEPIVAAEIVVGEDALSAATRATESDAEGHFRIGGLRAMAHRLSVHASGYVTLDDEMYDPGGDPLRLELSKAATVSGIVVDALDHPVPGVLVEVVGTSAAGAPVAMSAADLSFGRALVTAQLAGPEPALPSGELGVTLGPIPLIPVDPGSSPALADLGADRVGGDQPSGPDDGPSFATDEDGRFEIGGLPAGRYQLVGRHPTHAPGLGDPFVLTAGETRTDLSLTLPEGASIDGRLVDSRGFPVAHVRIEMHCEREPLARWTLAAEDGTFTFAGALGTCIFAAYPAGRPAARKTERIETAETGAPRAVELALADEVTALLARVVDEDGFPVAGARLAIRTLRADAPMRRAALSEDDGTVEIPGLPTPPYRLEVDADGFALEVVRRIETTDREHRIVLHPAATVVGRVLDDWEDAPASGVAVTLRSGRRTVATGRTDEGGIFELSRVAAGNYELLLEGEGLLSSTQPVALRASRRALEDLDMGDIRLSPGGSASGEVVDGLGAPVEGAVVAAGDRPEFSGPGTSRSGANGAFVIAGLVPGDVSLSARHSAAGTSEPVTVRVRPREESVGAVLRLPRRFDPSAAEEEGTERRRTGVAVTLRDDPEGVRIARVSTGSAAATAGLRPRDLIIRIDGEPLYGAAQGEGMLRGPVGSEVLVDVERGGQERTIAVVREAYER